MEDKMKRFFLVLFCLVSLAGVCAESPSPSTPALLVGDGDGTTVGPIHGLYVTPVPSTDPTDAQYTKDAPLQSPTFSALSVTTTASQIATGPKIVYLFLGPTATESIYVGASDSVTITTGQPVDDWWLFNVATGDVLWAISETAAIDVRKKEGTQ